MARPRRTQQQRRAATHTALLEAATALFGAHGYAATSIDDIAAAAGMTIRPIYHYFGNKLALFDAVNDRMELRILDVLNAPVIQTGGTLAIWRAFLDLCADPLFRQIVLIDAPVVLGRDRWVDSAVTHRVRALFAGERESGVDERSNLAQRMLYGAFTQAALAIAEAEDPDAARREALWLGAGLVERLLQPPGKQ